MLQFAHCFSTSVTSSTNAGQPRQVLNKRISAFWNWTSKILVLNWKSTSNLVWMMRNVAWIGMFWCVLNCFSAGDGAIYFANSEADFDYQKYALKEWKWVFIWFYLTFAYWIWYYRHENLRLKGRILRGVLIIFLSCASSKRREKGYERL